MFFVSFNLKNGNPNGKGEKISVGLDGNPVCIAYNGRNSPGKDSLNHIFFLIFKFYFLIFSIYKHKHT